MKNAVTVSQAEIADPLLSAIGAYTAARDRYNAGDDSLQEPEEAAGEFERLSQLYDGLRDRTPECTSNAGASAALRLAAADQLNFYDSGLPEALLESVMAFYRSETEREAFRH